MPDPVFFDDEIGKRFFWIETWHDTEGPFDSEEQAREALEIYCKVVLGNL